MMTTTPTTSRSGSGLYRQALIPALPAFDSKNLALSKMMTKSEGQTHNRQTAKKSTRDSQRVTKRSNRQKTAGRAQVFTPSPNLGISKSDVKSIGVQNGVKEINITNELPVF